MATDNNSPKVQASSLVSQVISTWRSGNDPNATDVLDSNPQLRHHNSLVIDLAYEEYCLRREAGEQVAVSTYCDRFPTVRKSLRVLLAAHECFDIDPQASVKPQGVPWPQTETTFLGFYLIREIGRGAFARVYLAKEPALGDRLVVVKIARKGGGEAETLGRMKHRNIVPVFSVQEDPETQLTAVCMPYLGCGTLLKALDPVGEPDGQPEQARLYVDVGQEDVILDAIPEDYTSPDKVLERTDFVDGSVHVIAQLADALAHAHAAGICHRDLKPSNVLIAPSGCPLLLDFNLSSDEQLQQTLIGGTLPYMPPEQLQHVLIDGGEETNLGDARSDIYSLGVILYELLAGKLPFGDQQPEESANVAAFRIMAAQEQGAPSLTSLDPSMDPNLVAIVDKCLQQDTEARFQTARELATQLRSCLTTSAAAKKWVHRRRFLLTATAAGMGLAAAAAGVGFALRPPYLERQYHAGIRAFERGDLVDAADYFEKAHRAAPDAYQPQFARAQVLVEMGRHDDASKILKQVYFQEPQGIIAAWAGYAYQMNDMRVPATFFYPRAIELHGYETAAVLNNLGCAYMYQAGFKLTSSGYFTRAIELDPNCQEAYIHRSSVFRKCGAELAPDGTPYRELALADAKLATTFEANEAQAYFTLAMAQLFSIPEPNRRSQVVNSLRQAIIHGFDREELLRLTASIERGSADLGLGDLTEELKDCGEDIEPQPCPKLLIAPPRDLPQLTSL